MVITAMIIWAVSLDHGFLRGHLVRFPLSVMAEECDIR